MWSWRKVISPAVTTGSGVESQKVIVNIGESHVLTLCVTNSHDNEKMAGVAGLEPGTNPTIARVKPLHPPQ